MILLISLALVPSVRRVPHNSVGPTQWWARHPPVQARSVDGRPPSVKELATQTAPDAALQLGCNYPSGNAFGELPGGPIHVPAPARELTNVNAHITYMCATMCSTIYESNASPTIGDKPEDSRGKALFEETIEQQRNWASASSADVELCIFDDHGDYKSCHAPMAMVVYGGTMIIAWRGSQTLSDWINDFSTTPILSKNWRDVAPELRIHAGYTALVDNEMCLHEDEFKKCIRDRNIKEVVFTGHSLGGGVAHVAHLFALATWANDETLPQVTYRSLCFESPMVFVVDDAGPKTQAVLDQLMDTARNFVFCGDAVPRMYGNLAYAEGLYHAAIENKLDLPPALGGVAHKISHSVLESALGSLEGLRMYYQVNANYYHYSKLIYYETPTSEPKLVAPSKVRAIPFSFYNEQICEYFSGDTYRDLHYCWHIHGVLPYAMSPQYWPLVPVGSADDS